MKKISLIIFLTFSQGVISVAPEQPVSDSKEKLKLTKLQKYSLIGFGAVATVGVAVFGSVKRYRYLEVNKPDKCGKLPLSKAIDDVSHYSKCNDTSKKRALNNVKKLISYGAKLNVTDGFDETYITRAARYGLTDVIIILLDHGAKIDFAKPNGDTALSVAAFLKYTDTVKLLIDRGANPNLGCNYYCNALFQALSKDESMADYILEHSKVEIDIDARGTKGDTLLIAACRFGRVKAVKTLLDLGSDVYAENYQWADHQSKETAAFVTQLLPQPTRDSIMKLLSEGYKKKIRIRKLVNT